MSKVCCQIRRASRKWSLFALQSSETAEILSQKCTKYHDAHSCIEGEFDRKELEDIASDPDEKNFIEVDNYNTLFNITDKLLNLVCNSK